MVTKAPGVLPLLLCRPWLANPFPIPFKKSRQQRNPIQLGGAGREGTIYLDPGQLGGRMVDHQRTGKAWRYFKTFTTYQPNTQVTYKNLNQLKVGSVEEFWTVQQECAASGLKPPTSFNDIFQQVAPSPFVRKTINAPFLHAAPHALQRAYEIGRIAGTVYHYDLNSAYRWSASEGLPHLKTAVRVLRVEDPWDIALVDLADPLPYRDRTELVTLTSAEQLQYCPRIIRYYYGWRFRKWIPFGELFAVLDTAFPSTVKKIGRAFWGRWNTRQAVEMVSWGSGKAKGTLLHNPYFNPIWTHYLISRVTARCLAVPDVLHVSHDSILTRERLPTGDAIGEWRCEHEMQRCHIVRTDCWGDGDSLLKHSGMTGERAAQWAGLKT